MRQGAIYFIDLLLTDQLEMEFDASIIHLSWLQYKCTSNYNLTKQRANVLNISINEWDIHVIITCVSFIFDKKNTHLKFD